VNKKQKTRWRKRKMRIRSKKIIKKKKNRKRIKRKAVDNKIINIIERVMVKVKVKQFHYSLDRPLGFQEVEAPRFFRQSEHESGKVVSPTHRPPLPPGKFPGTHFC
jgi:hypothetical protein